MQKNKKGFVEEIMNKLQGFYELKEMGLPAVRWNVFHKNTVLSSEWLWTIRVATLSGNDINLPRAIGVSAAEAMVAGTDFLHRYAQNDGMVIYYPYFLAEKSGIVDIHEDYTVIEAVDRDLWHLTTGGSHRVTMIIGRGGRCRQCTGDADFLSAAEVRELIRYTAKVRVKYRDYIFDRDSVMMEWSYARDAGPDGNAVSDKYLIFYECRVVKESHLEFLK